MPSFRALLFSAFCFLNLTPGQVWAVDCTDGANEWIRLSERTPEPGQSIRIKAISTEQALSEIKIVADEEARSIASEPSDGPPWVLDAQTTVPSSGNLRILALRNQKVVACRDLRSPSPDRSTRDGWTRADEAFYSAWIAQLFDAPSETELSFRSLEPVIRDPDRNFLYGYLGDNEDKKLPATPDCADLPYFLRAYFAWKNALPIAYRSCDRGSGTRPPHCSSPTIEDRLLGGMTSNTGFAQFSRKLFDVVHSGSARTAINDNSSDFYPLALTREALWPGTVYADPYGHTLILVKWVKPQDGKPGLLLAADAQPDNSVTRKRFWEGNFLFADIAGAGAGFKAFRPVFRQSGRWFIPDNEDLEREAPFGAFSNEQSHLAPDDFYARMENAMNPGGLKPLNAYESKLNALVEQVKTRANAVENGEQWARSHRGTVIPMPQGAAVFETTGPWEDFASPSRDMRLLIAINVVATFPESLRRHPELYQLEHEDPGIAADEVARYHRDRIQEIHFEYKRSDGSRYTLSLEQLFKRRESLEIGYNPNDCAEKRWGAIPGSEEYSTCTRTAPADQQARMEKYRPWFQSMQRPTR
jgi:hypothetical protein